MSAFSFPVTIPMVVAGVAIASVNQKAAIAVTTVITAALLVRASKSIFNPPVELTFRSSPDGSSNGFMINEDKKTLDETLKRLHTEAVDERHIFGSCKKINDSQLSITHNNNEYKVTKYYLRITIV